MKANLFSRSVKHSPIHIDAIQIFRIPIFIFRHQRQDDFKLSFVIGVQGICLDLIIPCFGIGYPTPSNRLSHKALCLSFQMNGIARFVSFFFDVQRYQESGAFVFFDLKVCITTIKFYPVQSVHSFFGQCKHGFARSIGVGGYLKRINDLSMCIQ